MAKKNKQKIQMEHIDRLSRGKKSGINIGSRNVGHHLHAFEREIYERSLKKGFLEVDERSRENLLNLWDKVCVAKGWKHVVVVKSSDRVSGEVLIDRKNIFTGTLVDSKKLGKENAQGNK